MKTRLLIPYMKQKSVSRLKPNWAQEIVLSTVHDVRENV